MTLQWNWGFIVLRHNCLLLLPISYANARWFPNLISTTEVSTQKINTRQDFEFLIIIINGELCLLISRRPNLCFKRYDQDRQAHPSQKSRIYWDILLVSTTYPEHLQLLSNVIKEYGIMVSQRKMVLAQQSVSLLGMEFVQGHYKPGTYIAEELLKFPEENLTV